MYGRPLTLGSPGSKPLPVPGNQGTAFTQAKMHPAAALGPQTNPMNMRQVQPVAPGTMGAGAKR